ncbi:MAG: hypothetical protein NXY57DRAFT_1038844 [Lentinula lateritia]|nr:MAG: hypothetical protein NXY57DRAFT_1038844 [Lentinula lateritia]
MALSEAKRLLDATKYKEGTKMSDHIKTMRTRLANVNDLSDIAIDDKTYCGILIRSIPLSPTWIPLIPTLYGISSSTGIVALLSTHAYTLYGDLESAVSSTPDTSLALAAMSSHDPSTPCKNPKCKAINKSSHGWPDCYWEGGGKEGQFPPNFGRARRNPRANVSTTTSGFSSTSTTPKANTATSHVEHFVMAARAGGHDPEAHQEIIVEEVVEPRRHFNQVSIEEIDECPAPFVGRWNGTRTFWGTNDNILDESDLEMVELPSDSEFEEVGTDAGDSCSEFELVGDSGDEEEVEDFMCDIPVSSCAFVTTTFAGKKPTITLNFMDSGASDHFMKHREDFTDIEYGSYDPGASAIEGAGSFKILGKGTAVKLFHMKGKLIRITFKNALLAPSLAANLISISALDKAGFFTTFGGNAAVVKRKDGTELFCGRGRDGMSNVKPSPPCGTIFTQ